MMGKVLMWVGIILGSILVLLFLFSTLMPQSMADFFMSFGAAEYNIEMDNKTHRIRFDDLGDGVESSDQLFIMKKMIAMHILAEYETEFSDKLTSFNEALIAASEDHTLSSVEVLDLKKMYEDFLPEERVNNWIDLVKDLEAKEEMEREAEEQ